LTKSKLPFSRAGEEMVASVSGERRVFPGADLMEAGEEMEAVFILWLMPI